MQSIALIGRARSGKDSVAAHLVANHGYRRVAFADPLKEIARRSDPIVDVSSQWAPRGLDDVLSMHGEDQTKNFHPEYRRFLERLGESVRDVLGERTWLDAALTTISRARMAGFPVVVTDVRYLNEATALRHLGFTMVRVTRPGLHLSPLTEAPHRSETELDEYKADEQINNDGTLDNLHEQASGLAYPQRTVLGASR